MEFTDEVSFIGVVISVEVLSLGKTKKQKEVRKIRETVQSLLNDMNSSLNVILKNDYYLDVDTVTTSPMNIFATLQDEHSWEKLQKSCDKIACLIIKHVFIWMEKEMKYELRLKPQKAKSKGSADTENVISVITNVIFEMIENKNYTELDFYKKLQSFSKKNDLRLLRSSNGLNPLHSCVVQKRVQFLLPLVYLKVFTFYMKDTVSNDTDSLFPGQTCKEIAKNMSMGRACIRALSTHEEFVESLTPFLLACRDGHVDVVKRMIDSDKSLSNQVDSMGNNSLHWAIVSDNVQLFNMLLKYKVDVNKVNNKGENVLHTACSLGKSQFIGTLIKEMDRDIAKAACKTNKRTPLDVVAENGDIESLNVFLANNLRIGPTIIPFAASAGRLTFIKYVFEKTKENLNIDSRDRSGRSGLMKASEYGYLKAVQYLCSKGASVNVIDQRRKTPLHLAAEHGHDAIVKFLLDNKADLNARDMYVGNDCTHIVRGTSHGKPAYHFVECRRNIITKMLATIRDGSVDLANYGVVIKSGWGEDPKESEKFWVAQMQDERKSAPNAPPDFSPLHGSIFNEQPSTAKLLINRGAHIDVACQFGLTPLMLCALKNDLETFRILEERGANFNLTDNENKNALDIAIMNESTEIANLLQSKICLKSCDAFQKGPLKDINEKLSVEKLETIRMGGDNVQQYIIACLRELTIECNSLLREVGSSPIVRPCSND